MCTISPYQVFMRNFVRRYGMDDLSTKDGGEIETKLEDYATVGDSISMAKIASAKFTIIAVEDSDYTDEKGIVTPGVKITTREKFTIDGEQYNKLHTTRIAVVNRLKNPKLRADLAASLGGLGPLVCKEVQPKSGGKKYFDLVEVN